MILSQLIDPVELIELNGGQIRAIVARVEREMVANPTVKKLMSSAARTAMHVLDSRRRIERSAEKANES